ncbi:MAG: signal peptide peptidase SppA [Chitinophagales bacterium]|nr:signal peptide peptidase SppA [Chitinophagales bacterium]MDW8428018.1 signal peptide peptidase SppA [Chitinophagales bacterium]
MGFWRMFSAALLAFVTGFVMLVLFVLLLFSALVATLSIEKPVSIKDASILHLNLNYEIPEQTHYDPIAEFSWSGLEPRVTVGLYDIISAISHAQQDERIKGIYLNCGFVGAGMATVEQLRQALEQFRSSGKFVIAYSEIYTEKGYYLSSVADQVFINPRGALEFNGISVQYLFFRRLLEKLGVEPQVFYAGRYKTASEPFRLDSMSAANEEMTRWLLDDLYSGMLQGISTSRGLSVSELDSISQHFSARTPTLAVRFGLVDSLMFDDQVRAHLRQLLRLPDSVALPLVSLTDYVSVAEQNQPVTTTRVALLFAQGDIVDGRGTRTSIGSARYADLLRKLREDSRIKAIVFRINSGGGSALASDVIAREVRITAEKKPVVVSMGDVAGSGGYYIAAYGSRIMAMPSTLTGSIGVFGVFPNTEKLFKDKLGITFDRVNTGKYSDFGDASRPLREDEKLIMQQIVDSVYRTFLTVVSEGRRLPLNQVDSVGQGRVWTGRQALKHGLIDSLGTLPDAIHLAASLAQVKEYRVTQYPEIDRDVLRLIENLAQKREAFSLRRKLGSAYSVFAQIEQLVSMTGLQARMWALPIVN